MIGLISMLNNWDFLNPFTYIMDVVNLIPKLVYFITATAMGLLDIAQMMIRKLAGLDVHYTVDGEPVTGDIALSFIQGIFGNDSNFVALRNAFWSLIILALILLVVATIVATIRQEYMPGPEESKEKPSNTKLHVINRAVKSLFMFMIVPVSVFMGLMFSDAILRAMDTVTSGAGSSAIFMVDGKVEQDGLGNDVVTYPKDRLVAETMGDGQTTSYIYYDFFSIGVPTTSTPFSGFAFKAAGFSANRVRIGKEYNANGDMKSFYELVNENNVSNFSIFNYATSQEEMASMIDDAFAGNVKLRNPQYLDYNSAANSDIKNNMVFIDLEVASFTKYNVGLVWYYYDLWQYNFVVAAAFLIISLKLMAKIVMGLMKRIIEIVALFIISPPIIALMPLDSGKAFGQWKNSFLSKALGVYGAIIGMNILFLLLPYINQIKFLQETAAFTVGGHSVYNNAAKMVNLIISTLFIITGLVMVDGLISLMSTIIGGDDVAKEGGDLVEKVGTTFQDSVNATALAAGAATKAVAAPFRLAKGGADAIGRSVTKNKDFDIGKATMSGLSSLGRKGLKKLTLPMSSKAAAAAGSKFADSWGEVGGAGDAAYKEYLQSQDSYKNHMNEAFENRSDKNLNYENWLNTEDGQSADKSSIILAQMGDVQGKGAFLKAEKGAGKEAYLKNLVQYTKEQASAYNRLQDFGGMLKNSKDRFKQSKIYGASSAVAAEAMKSLSSLSSYASNLYGTVEEAMGRKGKPAFFKTMALSFQGKSAKDLEKDKKFQDTVKELKLKDEYEKSKSGSSTKEVKDFVKKEDEKLKVKVEDEFKKEMREYFEEETKLLKQEVEKQREEISRLKKKK